MRPPLASSLSPRCRKRRFAFSTCHNYHRARYGNSMCEFLTNRRRKTMNRSSILVTLAAGLVSAVGAPVRAADPDSAAVAVRARSVLKQHCARCHYGEGGDGGDFDVLKVKTLTAARD